MKILMITPEPFFEPRGTPISVYSRLRMLSHIGFEVDLLTYPVGSDVEIPGVRIHRTLAVPFIRQVKIGPSLPKLLLDLLLFIKSFRMLLTNRYDAIHSHEEAAFFCLILASIFRVRHVYDMHSSLPRQLANFNFGNRWPIVKIFELLERRTIRASDVVITVGADLEVYIRQIDPQVSCTIIENLPVHEVLRSKPESLTFPQHSIPQGKFPVVYTGTLERYQGLNLILDGVATVSQYCPEVVYVIVGGTPDQLKYWREYVHNLQIDDHVVFTGRVSLEDSIGYLELAAILVSPRLDGTSVPLKIYSYMHSGKPIIATNIYAHTQILDDRMAVLVEPNPPAFADGIIRLIQSPDLCRTLGENARQRASECYNFEQQALKLKRVYQSLSITE